MITELKSVHIDLDRIALTVGAITQEHKSHMFINIASFEEELDGTSVLLEKMSCERPIANETVLSSESCYLLLHAFLANKLYGYSYRLSIRVMEEFKYKWRSSYLK